ncbi:hypothetical protein [Bosea beijingensis]
MLRAYRYDARDLEVGRIIVPERDHSESLDKSWAVTEAAIRAVSPDKEAIRKDSIYTWESEDWARKAWALEKGKYLYEVEIDEADIRHRGDTNAYGLVKDLLKAGKDPAPALMLYWSGEGVEAQLPRVELLVTKATVVSKMCSPSDKVNQKICDEPSPFSDFPAIEGRGY